MVQIKKSTLEFLSDIKQNNEREWFSRNRSRYEDARFNFESFVQALIEEITKFDPILKGLEAKSCTYRINRDIRFSNDKTIYKSHMGAFIVRGGKKNGDRFAGYYFHVEPGSSSMVAGGAYMPPMPWLTAIRSKIAENGDRFNEIIKDKTFKEYFGQIEGEKLKSTPRGYASDHPFADLLKYKSYLVSKMIPDKIVTGVECFSQVIEACKIMKPLNDFLNDVYL
ncbi:MAG: DUF2461 domain-containing protein [Bacteroidales bacterium]|nr:DUF2461 domain-containing protein [Bacteroidales bacterium]